LKPFIFLDLLHHSRTAESLQYQHSKYNYITYLSHFRNRCQHALALSCKYKKQKKIIVVAEGHVFSWGSNSHGELGLGDQQDRYEPSEIEDIRGKGISQVLATGYDGDSFSLALTAQGNIYSWGINGYAQLGMGDRDRRNYPALVTLIDNVVQISAGGFHVLALKRDGTVWAWGSNSEGRTGVGSNVGDVSHNVLPVPALQQIRVSQITSGGNFSFCITRNALNVFYTDFLR
jgi:alpha-tubulin suppressor-like RCC1 family protein